MPSSAERRDAIAAGATSTPTGARLDLSLYVYSDGRVWIQSPGLPGGGYSKTSHKLTVEDIEVMLHTVWRRVAEEEAA